MQQIIRRAALIHANRQWQQLLCPFLFLDLSVLPIILNSSAHLTRGVVGGGEKKFVFPSGRMTHSMMKSPERQPYFLESTLVIRLTEWQISFGNYQNLQLRLGGTNDF